MANEKRLIDANTSLCKKCDHYLVCKYADNEKTECSQYKAPTVDAVEVVRCKDCRKCSVWDDVITRQPQYVCRLWHGATREVDADSFCDAGERREGE